MDCPPNRDKCLSEHLSLVHALDGVDLARHTDTLSLAAPSETHLVPLHRKVEHDKGSRCCGLANQKAARSEETGGALNGNFIARKDQSATPRPKPVRP